MSDTDLLKRERVPARELRPGDEVIVVRLDQDVVERNTVARLLSRVIQPGDLNTVILNFEGFTITTSHATTFFKVVD